MAEVKLLKECPDYAPILGFWSYMEWYKDRSISFDLVTKAYKARIDDTSLPISWVAIEDEFPVGMISLKENDLWHRKDLNPWLASLYVLPEFRNLGIGSSLIEETIGKSKQLDFDNLFLFVSEDRRNALHNFYSKRDWRYTENSTGNDNDMVSIYKYSLR